LNLSKYNIDNLTTFSYQFLSILEQKIKYTNFPFWSFHDSNFPNFEVFTTRFYPIFRFSQPNFSQLDRYRYFSQLDKENRWQIVYNAIWHASSSYLYIYSYQVSMKSTKALPRYGSQHKSAGRTERRADKAKTISLRLLQGDNNMNVN